MDSGDYIITRLRDDEKVMQAKLEKMRKPVAQLEADLQVIQAAIALYQRSANNKMVAEVEEAITEAMATIPTSRLKGLSHTDAVVAIAKYNGGTVRTQEAKRLMIKAGIMSNTKNSTNMAHNAINRIDKFERIGPGEYRLKAESQKGSDEPERTVERLPVQ
jgi:hypothetical protein